MCALFFFSTTESMLRTDMKGILADCTDMVVIEDDEEKNKQEEGKKGKQRGRKKNLKLQKKDKQEEPEESKPETKADGELDCKSSGRFIQCLDIFYFLEKLRI